MKKSFVANNDAEALWDAMETEKFIEVKGGQSTSIVDSVSDGTITDDHTITLAKWVLSF